MRCIVPYVALLLSQLILCSENINIPFEDGPVKQYIPASLQNYPPLQQQCTFKSHTMDDLNELFCQKTATVLTEINKFLSTKNIKNLDELPVAPGDTMVAGVVHELDDLLSDWLRREIAYIQRILRHYYSYLSFVRYGINGIKKEWFEQRKQHLEHIDRMHRIILCMRRLPGIHVKQANERRMIILHDNGHIVSDYWLFTRDILYALADQQIAPFPDKPQASSGCSMSVNFSNVPPINKDMVRIIFQDNQNSPIISCMMDIYQHELDIYEGSLKSILSSIAPHISLDRRYPATETKEIGTTA